MTFSLSNRALLRAMLAGAVVLTGTACSRSDRAETGRDNSAAVLPDTSSNAQPSGGGTVTGAVNDTATGAATDTATTSVRSSSPAQPSPAAQSNTPRAETAPPSDKDAAGYRPMERDTIVTVPSATTSDTVAAEMSASSTDSAAVATAQIDTVAAGYAELARDTSSVADQADTAATPTGDVALEATVDTSSAANADVGVETGIATGDVADTTGNVDRIRSAEDSTEILGQVTPDSAAVAGSPDSTEVVRVRSPEDSTEVLGNVTTTEEAVDETADEQIINPEDQETIAASETPTDEVGAAAVGGNVTGAEAVALMSRAGVGCALVDPEANEAVRWDMSSTPVGLNPCGMGSMVLSRIWTAGR